MNEAVKYCDNYDAEIKIHGLRITRTELYYDGSITIDNNLLAYSNIHTGEQVHVLNISNGARFITYTIPGEPNSGEVVLNGPAARLGEVGDELIVLSYCQLTTRRAMKFNPTIVHVDKQNKVTSYH